MALNVEKKEMGEKRNTTGKKGKKEGRVEKKGGRKDRREEERMVGRKEERKEEQRLEGKEEGMEGRREKGMEGKGRTGSVLSATYLQFIESTHWEGESRLALRGVTQYTQMPSQVMSFGGRILEAEEN